MMGDTLLLVLIAEIGVLLSSILIAYGFSRFPLPGGDLLFYVLIATILIPEKVTLIPTFFFYVNFFHWYGTIYPLVVHLFFGNAVFIFLLRQNFKSLPLDLEEAAMLDGAGPLRRLFSVVLPQSWPVLVTISLLQFFYTWNETRLVTLYMGPNSQPLCRSRSQSSTTHPCVPSRTRSRPPTGAADHPGDRPDAVAAFLHAQHDHHRDGEKVNAAGTPRE